MNENKFVDYEGLRVIAQNVNARLKTVTELPEATSAGKTVLYVGESGAGHINGHIYQSKAEGEGFAWSDLTASSATGVIAKGTRAFSELPSLDEVEVGWMYNISDDFTTNENFVNAEIEEKLGSNVYCIEVEVGEGDDKTTVKKWDVFTAYITDQSYDAESTNAQSGKAVAEAVAEAGAGKLDKVEEMPEAYKGGLVAYAGKTNNKYTNSHIYSSKTNVAYGDTWEPKEWDKSVKNAGLRGEYVWTDGDHTYFSISSKSWKLSKDGTWEPKEWENFSISSGDKVKFLCDNCYYFYSDDKYYVFDKENDTWIEKAWQDTPVGVSPSVYYDIWSDGDNVYYSTYSGSGTGRQYILHLESGTFEVKTWSGSNNPNGRNVWTDGDNIYCSKAGGNYQWQYKLNKDTNTWESMRWNGSFISINGEYIYTIGNDVYYADNGNNRYKLNKVDKSWTGMTISGHSPSKSHIWTDGEDVYSSYSSDQYVLKSTKTYEWVDTTASAIPTTEIEGMFD